MNAQVEKQIDEIKEQTKNMNSSQKAKLGAYIAILIAIQSKGEEPIKRDIVKTSLDIMTAIVKKQLAMTVVEALAATLPEETDETGLKKMALKVATLGEKLVDLAEGFAKDADKSSGILTNLLEGLK